MEAGAADRKRSWEPHLKHQDKDMSHPGWLWSGRAEGLIRAGIMRLKPKLDCWWLGESMSSGGEGHASPRSSQRLEEDVSQGHLRDWNSHILPRVLSLPSASWSLLLPEITSQPEKPKTFPLLCAASACPFRRRGVTEELCRGGWSLRTQG